LEEIDDKKYDVFTDTTETNEKLQQAKDAYPNYTWFASYTIKDKQGNDVRTLDKEYTIKLDRPDSAKLELYYYLAGTAHPLPHEDTENKGNKKRVKAKLRIGDPPMGSVP
jgi:hypothetical protein